MSELTEGRWVRVHALSETPLEGVEERVRVEPQPPPDPATLKPTDVIIRIESAAVGWVDLLMTSGQYQHMPPLPYCPGLEYSGEVVWAGDEVDRVAVGDAVLADPFHTGPRSLGDYQSYGGFATYAVAPQRAALPRPRGLSADEAACLLSGYETAYHCLIHRGRVQEGEWVLIHGASGVTGLAAVHLAKRAGAKVIATGRSEDKLAVVKDEGADHVICTAGDDGELVRFRDEVKELTSGGAHIVYDPVGGPISIESMRAARFGARYLIVGWAATPFVAKGKGGRGAPRANQFPTNLVMMKSLDVLGCPAAIAAHKDPSLREARLRDILAWVEAGEIRPRVGATFAIEDVQDAMRAKWASRFVGGCVLRP